MAPDSFPECHCVRQGGNFHKSTSIEMYDSCEKLVSNYVENTKLLQRKVFPDNCNLNPLEN